MNIANIKVFPGLCGSKDIDAMNHEQWLESRKKSIGASEIASVLGLNKYKSAYTLWAEKCGLVEPVNETIPMRVGHALEPLIARLYEEQTGRPLTDPGDYAITAHPEYPFLTATCDRLVMDGPLVERVVELKSMNERAAAELAEDAAIAHQCQLQQQMAVTGAALGDIAVLVGNRELRVFEYARNDRFIETVLIPQAVHFWKHVETQTPPEVDESLSTADTLKKLHPADTGEIVGVDENLVASYLRVSAQIKELESEKQLWENRLRAAIGDATFGEADGYQVSLKTQGKSGGCSIAWKTEEEKAVIHSALSARGIAHKISEPTTYRVLRVKEKNDE